jgi:hypothetical protein
MLEQGMTARQLARAFSMDTTAVARRLSAVVPSGQRDGQHIWRLRDAAPELCAPPADMVARVIRMNHTDLPPKLRKEYWDGQKAQLAVLNEEGRIWRSDAVLSYVGAAFRSIRMQVALIPDVLAKRAELTDEQAQIVQEAVDGCLAEIRVQLKHQFDGREDDIGKSATSLLEPVRQETEDAL